MRRNAALIVGAGPAGCAAAICLQRAGAAPLLVERSRETGDALCGGFLSWHTLAALDRLGLSADQLGGAPIRHVRLFAGPRSAQARLPAVSMGLSRHRLDTLLQQRAMAEGTGFERGITARADDAGQVTLDGVPADTDALFLATGKHDLRGLARPRSAAGIDPVIGLRTRLPPSPALQGLVGDAVELHLFDRGYAGLNLQEDGTGNLCMAVHRSRLDAAGSPSALLAELAQQLPALGERMVGWREDAAIDAVANVPYGWRARTGTPGLFRLGDQAGVIPSLAGEGMGIAIASGMRAAAAFTRGGPPAAVPYQVALARDLARPLAIAGWVRDLGEGARTGWMIPPLVQRLPGLAAMIARLTRIRGD